MATSGDEMSGDEMSEMRQKALGLMKPLCMTLMQDRTTGNVKAILKALPNVDSQVAREIQVFIMFPIKTALGMNNISDSMFLPLCQTVEAVYEKTKFASSQDAYDIISLVLLHVMPLNQPSRLSKMSEDSKKAMCNAIISMLSPMDKMASEQFYSWNHLPAIGQLVSILLQIAEFERSMSTQCAALSCLKILYTYPDSIDLPTRENIGFDLSFCLPAVTMAAMRIIVGDSKQGHKVFVEATELWTTAVYRCINNRMYQIATDYPEALQQQREYLKKDMKNYVGLVVIRDKAWSDLTAEKLKILFEKLLKSRSQSHWKSRLALIDLAGSLLSQCNKPLVTIVPLAVDLLVGFLADSYQQVSKAATKVLQRYSHCLDNDGQRRHLVSTLQENLYSLCTSLPRQMRMADEDDKLAIIKLLKGYLMLLGNDVQSVLHSYAHLHRIGLGLLHSLELDTHDRQILEERSMPLHSDQDIFIDDSTHGKVWQRRKYFKHTTDPSVVAELFEVCRLLGKFGDLLILVDFFLELYHESSTYQLTAVLIINEMVAGASSTTKPNVIVLKDLIRLLLDEYLSLENMRSLDVFEEKFKKSSSSTVLSSPSSSLSPLLSSLVPSSSSFLIIESSETLESKKRLSEKNKRIMKMCLFMEGIGTFATALGQEFSIHLIDALYPLVEHLGHENVILSSTAHSALTHICLACGYKSLDMLLQENADYLVSSVSVKLRHICENRRCPQTLCVMLQHCSHQLLPLVDHSIIQLLDTLDDHYTDEIVLFLPALLDLAFAIGRWFPSSNQETVETSIKKCNELCSENLKSFVEEYIRLKKVSELEEPDDEEKNSEHRSLVDIEADMKRLTMEQKEKASRDEAEAEEKEDEERSNEKEEIPQHIIVVKEILSRVKHFITSHDGQLRIKSLDVLCQCVKNLQGNSKQLLPQIHQFWSSFIPLFQSDEKFIVIKALVVLRLISELAGDFVRHRFMKNILPGIMLFMEKQAHISSGSRQAYLMANSFKLQLAVLQNIGPISKNLGLDFVDLECVIKMCLPYLCEKQPKPLQEACYQSVTGLIDLDQDSVWLQLVSLYCPALPSPPTPQFALTKISVIQGERNSFTTNVQHLFDTFYS